MEPTITQEIKYGRKMMDCVSFFIHFPAISLRIMAKAISSTVLISINARLYRAVFLVTSKAFPDSKKNRKLSRPTHGLPNIPSA